LREGNVRASNIAGKPRKLGCKSRQRARVSRGSLQKSVGNEALVKREMKASGWMS